MAIEITAFCENCHQRGAVVVSARDARPLCPSCGRFLLEIREISGFIYIISNSAMPGLLIGQTTRGVDERAAELNAATGVRHYSLLKRGLRAPILSLTRTNFTVI